MNYRFMSNFWETVLLNWQKEVYLTHGTLNKPKADDCVGDKSDDAI